MYRVKYKLVVCLALFGCASPPSVNEPPDLSQPDPVLLRNLKEVSRQPGIADIAWRQPKESIPGDDGEALSTDSHVFPSQSAVTEAIEYSRAQNGRGLMVWYDGQLVVSDFADGLDSQTPTATYSMHKTLLAMTVLAAIEDGIIESLDTSVAAYIEEWAESPQGQLSFRQLLTHTSGLKHYSFAKQEPMATALVLSSRVRAVALAHPLESELPAAFNYSNVNSQIAGIALEGALASEGIRYAEYLSDRIWKPVGNNSASLWLEHDNGSARYFSGLEAGLEDWLRMGVLIANNGRSLTGQQILSEASVKALTHQSAGNPAYGLHVWLGAAWQSQRSYGPGTPFTVPHSKPYLAPDVFFFDGFGGQRVYVVPSARLVIARIGEVSFTYDDSIIVNTLLRGLLKKRTEEATTNFGSVETERMYQQRFQRLLAESRNGSGLSGYDPLISVPGASHVDELPKEPGDAEWLDIETAQSLTEYAAESNSTALLIWHRDRLIMSEYFGDTNIDSLVNSRSLAKPLSVVAVGRAVQAGFIENIDQPAADFIAEWRGTPKAAITLRHLLQMRSGLARQSGSRDPDDVMNRSYLHPYHAETIINEYPLVNEPGSRYDYANANAELIAPIIERATGRSYEQWITESILKPIGAAGGDIWINRDGGTTHSGCCILLPAETWLRLSVLILNDGRWKGQRLLPDGFVTMMKTPTEQNIHSGMGLFVAGPYVEYRGSMHPEIDFNRSYHSEPYLDKDLFLFDGNGHQVSYHLPNQDLVILRLGGNPQEGFQWDNAFLPNTVLRAYAKGTGESPAPQSR